MANKLDFGIWMGGRSWPVWHYRELPDGVRPACLQDLQRDGTPVIFRVRIGPHAGEWYTDLVRPASRPALLQMLHDGHPLYVRKK